MAEKWEDVPHVRYLPEKGSPRGSLTWWGFACCLGRGKRSEAEGSVCWHGFGLLDLGSSTGRNPAVI